MQTVTVTVESMDFFCPVTGQKVFGDDGTCAPSRATKGYWLNEVPTEPEIMDEGLAASWEEWLSGMDQDEVIDCSEFLAQYEGENWVAFGLATQGMPGDIGYVVIDMAAHQLD